MNILVLNGSPRPAGNTAALVEAFAEGAKEKGHQVKVISVCQKEIKGCLGCEYCHTKGDGKCVQQDDMNQIYEAIQEAEGLVLASPIYYFSFSGQLHCAIHRTYAIGIPKKLRKTAMLLSSGADEVYQGVIWEYQQGFIEYMGTENAGIVTAYGGQNKSPEKLEEARQLGRNF